MKELKILKLDKRYHVSIFYQIKSNDFSYYDIINIYCNCYAYEDEYLILYDEKMNIISIIQLNEFGKVVIN